MIYDYLLQQLKEMPEAREEKVDLSRLPNQVMTIDDILQHADEWESCLHEITGALTLTERVKENLRLVPAIPGKGMVIGL